MNRALSQKAEERVVPRTYDNPEKGGVEILEAAKMCGKITICTPANTKDTEKMQASTKATAMLFTAHCLIPGHYILPREHQTHPEISKVEGACAVVRVPAYY